MTPAAYQAVEATSGKFAPIKPHRHLVDAGNAIPTILVIAYPEEAVRDRTLKDGVVCYLSKPVCDNHLERCLRSALEPDTPVEENSCVLLSRRQGELKYGAARLVRFHP
jgi:CheY-like chemotaxis protein